VRGKHNGKIWKLKQQEPIPPLLITLFLYLEGLYRLRIYCIKRSDKGGFSLVLLFGKKPHREQQRAKSRDDPPLSGVVLGSLSFFFLLGDYTGTQ
jgi:hypothetical protein